MPTARIDLVWSSDELRSAEHFTLRQAPGSSTLSGTAVLAADDVPCHVDYRVEVDGGWRTVSAEAEVERAGHQSFRMEVDDGRWTVDGVRRTDLDGCLDVDLGWTPATNLLPIHRLGLAVGEADTIEAAWLRFPELELVRSTQEYERVGDDTYTYRSGPYEFLLRTTPEGVVSRYGDDLWVATSVVRS